MGKSYESLRAEVKRLQNEGKLSTRLTREQMADWAYGNTKIENDDVTQEMAVKAANACITKEKKMGFLDKYRGKIGNAELTGRSKYFPNEGVHNVLIKRVKGINNRKVCVVIECKVESSTSDELGAGDTVSQVIVLGDEYGYGERDLKRFVLELNGIEVDDSSSFEKLSEIEPDLADSDDPVTDFLQMLMDASEDDLDLPATVETWLYVTKNGKAVTRMRWASR